ncbi:formin-binding protein HOF1 [Lachancea thermotolerans CBS 6340]|uniref:KLTH0D08580p n=1 Tax=Lachancea thermotolerans (strain ATCC 56472 / CBS 6340 / NRRL Y-8284) TaxID=559295 RepID=C5DGV4_LACTC|nr:KLTH0D08580p [Lachancea thermotolerans CBS 6340]CAR22646.1 KLTH0D08580p [Lachancea thermotolerans CBS 6340]
MSHSYNYQLSFWDEQDTGTRILLEHVSQGLESCEGLIDFFEERSKLEKDYARRLSAITAKFNSNIQSQPDYGKLGLSVKSLHSSQERLSQSHSKQAVAIYRDGFSELKLFVQDLQARYKTISLKTRNLCNDKITKKQLCDVLQGKLEKASTELRDCQLNQDNYLGKRDSSQNDRHIQKWRSIVDELQMKLDVLKQEYKNSTKHWLHEWSRLSLELQELERSRIQFIKVKLQEFSKQCSDAAVEEQISMDNLTQQLTKFTADQDISSFAYNHGTGRIRGNFVHAASADSPRTSSTSSKHVQNVRQLSSQLQRSRLSGYYEEQAADVPHPEVEKQKPEPTKLDRLEPPETAAEVYTSSESSNESSNPTEFTSNVRHRASVESMSTSISSLAHSIGDSQRFAKSWNSQNRRKSKTRSQLLESSQSSNLNEGSRTSSMETTRFHASSGPRTTQRRKSMVASDSSSNPFKEALEAMKRGSSGYDDVEDERPSNSTSSQKKHLIPFQHSRSSTNETCTKRVMDKDHYVELPLFSSKGEEVLRYAKALYTFMEPNEQQIVNFHVGDYLLLTEQLDQDWFIGEVLDSQNVDPEYRYGIIPRNYIEILP